MTDEQSAAAAVARTSRDAVKRKFCEILAEGLGAGGAAKAVGISRRTAFYWRTADPEFARAWAEAEQVRVEQLERVAFRRAVEGDAALLKFLLAAHCPEKYSERSRIDVTTGGMPLSLTDAERAVRVLQLISAIQQGTPLTPSNAPIDDAEWREVDGAEDLV